MHKLIGWLAVGLALCGLALGALMGRSWADTRPPVVAAIAEQEAARADALRAQAAAEWARAERARLDTQAAAEALPERVAGLRWAWLLGGMGAGIGALVLLVGLALAAVVWAHVRARVIYPNDSGLWPVLVERRMGGELLLADMSPRSLSTVTLIGPGGDVSMNYSGSEAAALQLAQVEQQRAALVGAVRAAHDVRASEHVLERARQALPVFAAAPASGGDGLRFVYVKAPGQANSEANRQLADVREFIERGSVVGFGRRAWLGHKFRSGHECTRTRFDELTDMLKRAGVVTPHGQSIRLAVSVAEALGAFGVGDADTLAGTRDDAPGAGELGGEDPGQGD